MEDEKFSFNGTFQKGKEYIDTQLRLAKLKAMANGSKIFGSVVVDITKLIIALLVLFFFSMALGFFLGEVLHSNALGFFLTGCLFLFSLLVIRLLEPRLENLFRDSIIQKLTSKWEDDDQQDSDTVKADGHEEKK